VTSPPLTTSLQSVCPAGSNALPGAVTTLSPALAAGAAPPKVSVLMKLLAASSALTVDVLVIRMRSCDAEMQSKVAVAE
jgi:hypothetical protein